ncbi:MAG: hypothetical protein L6R41_007289 [Letrouitia leprolyta]|nr:MAG: hypothetical protein L6R41_007289 [Letrouitia leprolyta]
MPSKKKAATTAAMETSISQPTNSQSQSPLFYLVPPEVRNQIFQLALTAYEDPTRKYRPNAYHYRPDFTCARRIDTALLRTCRRIYWETFRIPASINEHTSWFGRAPPDLKKNHLPVEVSLGSTFRRQHLRTVHIFVQQISLEGAAFAGFTGLWEYACPTTLIITLRHSDWWWWEQEQPLRFDPKQAGQASTARLSRPSDAFAPRSWGNQFRKIKGLEKLQIELETAEATKKLELDAIVDRAEGWAFPLGDDRVLRLNQSKTKRDGWVGVRLDIRNEKGKEVVDILNDIEEEQKRKEFALSQRDQGSTSLPSTEVTDTSIAQEDREDGEDEENSFDSTANELDTSADAEDYASTPDQGTATDPQRALQQEPPIDIGMRNPTAEQVGQLTKPLEVQRPRSRLLEAAGVVFDDARRVTGLPLEMTLRYYIVTLTWDAQQA